MQDAGRALPGLSGVRRAGALRRDFGGPSCPQCRTGLDPAFIGSGRVSCSQCGTLFEAVRFDPPPPLVLVRSVAEAGPTGEASCAAHAGNVAVGHCSRCGVFMCDLCRIDTDGMALCPSCFDRLAAEGTLASTRTSFRDYGRMGLQMLLVGLLFWFVAVPFGLAAIYAGVQELRQRRRIGEGSAVRAWVSVVLGLVWTVGSVLLLASVFGGMK
jgi:hypothetical protein